MLVGGVAAAALATALISGLTGAGGLSAVATQGVATARAEAGSPSPALVFQSELGLPATKVEMIGASPGATIGPGESPGEVWAVGQLSSVGALGDGLGVVAGEPEPSVLLRRSSQTGWQVVPIVDQQGNPLGFTGTPEVDYQAVTYEGGVVLLGKDAKGAETVITRSQSGTFAAAPAPSSGEGEAVLDAGEQLYSPTAPLAVALDEADHATGALVVPQPSSHGDATAGLLHYDGTQWTREPLCESYSSGPTCTTTEQFESLHILALAASSPQNAWLLASIESSNRLVLFQRHATGSGTFVWVQPQGWTFGADLPSGVDVVPRSQGAMLTVTNAGVWVDAALQAEGSSVGSVSQLSSTSTPGEVLGTWCYPTPQAESSYPTPESLCGAHAQSLGASLPNEYSSFAWPGTGKTPGTRIVTGLEDGALLVLDGEGDFHYTIGVGGGGRRSAFISPEEGWLSEASAIGSNGAQVVRATTTPESPQLQSWPVPFERPLLAIVPQPATTPGDPSAQALAVGDQGQIARYISGEGWTPEFLYNSAGVVQRPRLRGVAWPEPGRAYAVGDAGAMWVWRADTGLWEPDPAKPLGFSGNLNAIAFSASDPTVGYAVGKQGVLLKYGKTWEQISEAEAEEIASELKFEAKKSEEQRLNFTSVAFAGEQVLVTFRMVDANGTTESGGLLVKEGKEGATWHVDQNVQKLLSGLPPAATVLSRVSGLSDGGAVAAGPGIVIERDPAGLEHDEWHLSSQPLPEAQNIDALAAIQEGPSVRALLSIDADSLGDPNQANQGSNHWLKADTLASSGFGQPPALLEPDPLPVSGYLMRETAAGWQDLEHQAFPSVIDSTISFDEPAWPDPVLALDVDPSTGEGWAVGGQTGGLLALSSVEGAQLAAQTASVQHIGTDSAPPASSEAAIPIPSGQVTFAVGGNAQCAGLCADFAGDGLGPDRWLAAAVSRAAQIGGLRGFLYTGAHVAVASTGQSAPSPDAFAREMAQYASDLHAGGGLPVYPAASPSDAQGGSLSVFNSTVLGGLAGSVPSGTSSPPAGTAAYAFESSSNGVAVRVIVLDYSTPALAPGELSWLEGQLAAARAAQTPAIVMGSANLIDAEASNYAQDAQAISRALLEGGASAYFFDSPEENRVGRIGSGADSIPAIGTGTLGYVLPPARRTEFLGAGGFLLASVDVARREQSNRAPVSVELIPNIAQLSLDATDGTLLRRSQVALFAALARRPQAGFELAGGSSTAAEIAPEPYVPIPEICEGPRCFEFLAPSYTFTSSKPDIGNFVEPQPGNTNPRAVFQGPGGKPVPDPQSGIFCAFNAGTTTVSIQTGGLVYSEQITVQAGSVEQPCGTVPLVNPPPAESKASTKPPPPPPGSAPGATPTSIVPVPPAPVLLPATVPRIAAAAPRHASPRPPFFLPPQPAVPLIAALLPISPIFARPIPPSGTAPVSVFSPAVAPQEEREVEEAVESVHNMAAYRPDEPGPPAIAWLALITLALGAGAGAVLRTTSRGPSARRKPSLARATTSGPRAYATDPHKYKQRKRWH
jgi:hypothetical protein